MQWGVRGRGEGHVGQRGGTGEEQSAVSWGGWGHLGYPQCRLVEPALEAQDAGECVADRAGSDQGDV